MTFASFLINLYSLVPRLNFKFNWTKDIFNLDRESEYFQALVLIACLGAVISVLLLITVIIAWACRLCGKNDVAGKTRRRVRRLTGILFALSVICFVLLGVCLFANEHVSRGVGMSVDALTFTKKALKISMSQIDQFQEVALKASEDLRGLEKAAHNEAAKAKNATLVQEIDRILTNITDEIDIITKNGKGLKEVAQGGVENVEDIRKTFSQYETERWGFSIVFLTVIISVMFNGVIAFCRQSKKGAIIFSSVGLFVFIVTLAVFSIAVPLTIGLSDFCRNGDQVTQKQLGDLYERIKYYNICSPSLAHDNLPPKINYHLTLLNNIPASKSQLDRLMTVAFNNSAAVATASGVVGDRITQLLKLAGGVSSSSACYVFKDEIRNFYYGTCDQAIAGMSIFLLVLFLLSLFLFILLIVVSKTWALFSRLSKASYPVRVRPFRYESATTHDCALPIGRMQSSVSSPTPCVTSYTFNKKVSFRPHEYVEVDEDDPFFPRGVNDSTIPVDIYGTHVYNPRTRDRTEPSTNTTSGTADEPNPPLWSQHNVTAPLVTNSMSRQPFMSDHPYSNYEDRYNM